MSISLVQQHCSFRLACSCWWGCGGTGGRGVQRGGEASSAAGESLSVGWRLEKVRRKRTRSVGGHNVKNEGCLL